MKALAPFFYFPLSPCLLSLPPSPFPTAGVLEKHPFGWLGCSVSRRYRERQPAMKTPPISISPPFPCPPLGTLPSQSPPPAASSPEKHPIWMVRVLRVKQVQGEAASHGGHCRTAGALKGRNLIRCQCLGHLQLASNCMNKYSDAWRGKCKQSKGQQVRKINAAANNHDHFL